MPLPVTIFTPDFLRLEHVELQALLNKLRDPLTVHVFFLIKSQADFKTGHLLTNYKRLQELCTPPQPERGRRMKPPTIDQLRRAVDWLVGADLMRRDADENAKQGLLKLQVLRSIKKARPAVYVPG